MVKKVHDQETLPARSKTFDISVWEFVNESADKIRIAEAEAAYIRHFKARQARQLRKERVNAVVSAAVFIAMVVLSFVAENLF